MAIAAAALVTVGALVHFDIAAFVVGLGSLTLAVPAALYGLRETRRHEARRAASHAADVKEAEAAAG
jgi:hypothetical protein